MKNGTLLGGIVAVALIFSIGNFVALAQHAGHGSGGMGDYSPSPAPAVRSGKAKGKVVEFDRTSLTVEMQRKGRAEKATFLINDRTKTKGNLEVGAEAVVKYLEEMGVSTATSVEVKKPKSGKAGV